MPELDVMNKFLVAAGGRGITVLKPLPLSMTPDDALLLAAWLVSLAEHEASHDFEAVLRAVQNT